MTTHTTVAWSEGRWLHDPAEHHIDDAGTLVVTATETVSYTHLTLPTN